MDSSMLMPGNAATDFPGALNGAGSAGAQTHGEPDKLAESAHETVERLSSAAHHTVDKLADGAAQACWMSQTPARILASSRSWIQEKPLETVGIALAVGYFVGRMRA